MRLLYFSDAGQLSLTRDLQDNEIPPYAILSHTWGNDDEETTFPEISQGPDKGKSGYAKIQFCGDQARRNGLQYFWVDTCCIDKANNTELTEAITSMFRWYANAVQCYVFLSDVLARKRDVQGGNSLWESAFRRSRWFTRGWTLQELLAPRQVEFFSREGQRLGDKITLQQEIHEITGIPVAALHGALISDFSISERKRWASSRTTKKPEDKAYCLLGIFNIYMPLIYGEGDNAFVRLEREISNSKPTLQEVDAKVRNYYLRDRRLGIERLSGKALPMERCFINLSMVDHIRSRDGTGPYRELGSYADIRYDVSKYSLAARLRVESPLRSNQVTLQTLFMPRRRPDGRTGRPNRILIWGQAGIGKTTLCKRIIHDFVQNHLWHKLFDRVYWLPLRRLKLVRKETNNLGELIQRVCFGGDGRFHLEVLQDTLETYSDRSLLILDGLDEVSCAFAQDSPMADYLNRLLEQENVIITSRPHNTNILSFIRLDLELETVGFFPKQVEEFLQCEIEIGTSKETISEIRSFVRSHPVVQSLIRIPIQLDAICYAWNAARFSKDSISMTTLYQAITRQLWEKDTIRLGRSMDGEQIRWQQIQDCADIRPFVKTEADLLEELAFMGLYNEIIEFSQKHLSKVARGQVKIPNDLLVNSSLLRSSDNALNSTDRTYHFIHFTFQEFFAAQYFVRHWLDHATITLIKMGTIDVRSSKGTGQITPENFLQNEKYNDRYNIFWRFVAGLIEIEDTECHLHRFFQVLEGEPRDLLGPAQQRLIIQCLGEVQSADGGFQSRARELEDNYWAWIQFESRTSSTMRLMQEVDCPDRILKPWLEGSDEDKIRVMSTLKLRPTVSLEILRMAMYEARESTHEKVLTVAFSVLGKHCNQEFKENFFDLIYNREENLQKIAWDALADADELGVTAIEALTGLLHHKESSVRSSAAQAFRGQSSLPDYTIDVLTGLLQDKNSDVRSCAAQALRGQSSLPEISVNALTGLLQDDDFELRHCAAEALHAQCSLPDRAISAVTGLLKDKDPYIRYCAAEALCGQSSLPDPAVDALTELLEDEDSYVRSHVAEALRGQSDLPKRAVNALTRLLRDKDSHIRSCAAQALHGQSSLLGRTVNALTGLLQDKDPYVRSCAAETLRKQSSLPDPAVSALIKLLQDKDFEVRSCAAEALHRQSSLPDPAVSALTGLLQDEDSDVRCCAAQALGGQSRLPDPPVNALTRLLQDGIPYVRSGAAKVLSGQSTLPDFTIDALTGLLQDKDSNIRSCATQALCGQISLPNATVNALIRLLQDDDSQVQSRAAHTLQLHRAFYPLIPTLDSPTIQNLLIIWLKRSLSDFATCSVWNNTLSINVSGRPWEITLTEGDGVLFRHKCLQAQKVVGTPPFRMYREAS